MSESLEELPTKTFIHVRGAKCVENMQTFEGLLFQGQAEVREKFYMQPMDETQNFWLIESKMCRSSCS